MINIVLYNITKYISHLVYENYAEHCNKTYSKKSNREK